MEPLEVIRSWEGGFLISRSQRAPDLTGRVSPTSGWWDRRAFSERGNAEAGAGFQQLWSFAFRAWEVGGPGHSVGVLRVRWDGVPGKETSPPRLSFFGTTFCLKAFLLAAGRYSGHPYMPFLPRRSITFDGDGSTRSTAGFGPQVWLFCHYLSGAAQPQPSTPPPFCAVRCCFAHLSQAGAAWGWPVAASCHSLIALHSNAAEPSAPVGLDHSWGHLEPEHLEHLEAGREHRDIVITNPFWKVVRKIINTRLKKNQDTGGHFSQRGNSREARLGLLGDALRPLHHFVRLRPENPLCQALEET